MKYAAIILGIITATLLLPQDAFARGGKRKPKSDHGRVKREVVVETVVVEPVVVESTAERRHDHGRRVHRQRRQPHGRTYDRHSSRVHGHRHHQYCEWIPGHYENRAREIVVPGYLRKVTVPARYIEHRGPRGITFKVLVRPTRVLKVWVPARAETRIERVWVAGRYACDH